MVYMCFKDVPVSEVLITLFGLIETSFSASIFDPELSPPYKDYRIGYQRMTQTINEHTPPKTTMNNQPKKNSNHGSINPFSYRNNFYQPSSFHTPMISSPTHIGFIDNINKLRPDNQTQDTGTLAKKTDHGYKSENLRSSEGIEQNTEVSELDSDVKLVWPDSTDYTTETSDYEAATEDELNRIGVAPAVIASLLG